MAFCLKKVASIEFTFERLNALFEGYRVLMNDS